MNLTIAQRVYGGFATIIALLLFSSFGSLKNLSDIDGAVQEVNQVSIPTLTGSSDLKESFLNINRITGNSFYQSDIQKLKSNAEVFSAEKDKFLKSLTKLRNASKGNSSLTQKLKVIEESFNLVAADTEALLSSRESALALGQDLESQFEDLEELVDDASTYILDFTDLELEGPKNEKAMGGASSLDTTLVAVLSALTDLKGNNQIISARNMKADIEVAVSKITKDMQYVLENAEGGEDVLSDISANIEEITSKISSNDGFVQTKMEKLRLNQQAEQLLGNIESKSNEAITELNDVQQVAHNLSLNIQEKVLDQVDSGTYSTAIIALISVVVAGFVAWYSTTSILGPLKQVNDMLHVVASGDLTRKVDYAAKDELGELSQSCNSLIDNLRNLINGIMSRSSQLAAASEETSAITKETSESINEQKSQVAQAATATTEMSSTSQSVVHSAGDALTAIENADKEAERVKSLSLSNRETIVNLAGEVDSAAQVIHKLNQDSAAIGSILDVIRGIAEQTNLLALNAAIEAARAGEQGRGFAVVADEVRTLASRTQESTQEIQNMIEMLQSGAQEAVAVMDKGKSQAEVCVEQTEKATDALQHITNAVHTAYDMSTQIAEAAKEQNLVAQDISEKLENIVGIAEETASGAEQTSTSSHEVARLAEELEGSVREFRV